MQIIGISLKDYGSSGMKITYRKYRKFDSTHATAIDGAESYELPVPVNIRAEIKSLKYYLIYLMKLWNDNWDKYLMDDLSVLKPQSELDKMIDFDEAEYSEAADIFNNTYFESYKLDKGGFSLSGDIEIISGKMVKIKLPVIVEDDDFTLFNDCLDIIEKINEMIVDYFSKPELSIEDIKETLKLISGDKMKAEIDNMDNDESYQHMIAKLEAKGGIVLIEEGSNLEKEIEEDTNVLKVVSTNTLKENNIEPAEEIKENNESDDEPKPDGDSGDPPTDFEEF